MSVMLRTKRQSRIATMLLQRRNLSSTMTQASTAADNDHDAPSKKQSAPSCPITGLSPPQLKHMPSLPFLGSTLNYLFTDDTPVIEPKRVYNNMIRDRRKYGLFMSKGFPGFGSGLHGTIYGIADPNEMLKIIRAEGSHPSGIVQSIWTVIAALRKDGSAMISQDDNGLFGQGERWKTQRTFLQTGMLDPRAARGYLPGILKAARMASGGAPLWRDDLNRYLNFCAFDMFGTFMLGDFTGCAAAAVERGDEEGEEREEWEGENVRFCHAAIDAMEKSSKLFQTPYEFIMHKLGIETKSYADFYSSWSVVREIGMRKLNRFVEKYERGELNEFERASYFANALYRLENDEGNGVSKDEMLELCLVAFFVGVDTTSGVTAWNLVHLALNPNVQDKLYHELSTAIKSTGELTPDGQLYITPRTLEKKHTPYLHNILRETNRLTPPFGNIASKRATRSSVNINGVTLPRDSQFFLASVYNDPVYLPDARDFKPERWGPDAVAARQGDPSKDTMDHALFRDSFGQGARRCPGSRVATNEVLAMLAQLVWDYEIIMPEGVKRLEDVEYDFSALITPHIPKLEFRPRRS